MSAAVFSSSQKCNYTVQRLKNMYYKKKSNKLLHVTYLINSYNFLKRSGNEI